jgi:hypothetical protein
MKKLLLKLLIVYLSSIIFNYWFIHVSYSKEGTRSLANPGFISVIVTFCPVINNIMTLYFLVDWPPYKTENKYNRYKTLFKIKN